MSFMSRFSISWLEDMGINFDNCEVCTRTIRNRTLKTSAFMLIIASQARKIDRKKTSFRKILLKRANLKDTSFNPGIDASAFVRSLMGGDEKLDPKECPMCKNRCDVNELLRVQTELELEDANREVKLLKRKKPNTQASVNSESFAPQG